MLFTVSVYNPFLLDGDQCGVVEADSTIEALAQMRTWVEAQLKDMADDYKLLEVYVIPGSDQSELVVKTENKEGAKGEDSVIIRLVESPFMFMAEDWALVFD